MKFQIDYLWCANNVIEYVMSSAICYTISILEVKLANSELSWGCIA